MEFIVLTLGYFMLLGGMIYKGADLPSILAAAGLYVSTYLGLRKSAGKKLSFKEDADGDEL